MSTTAHTTIVLERTYDATPAQVFAAFAEPTARAEWAVPSGNIMLVYDAADFRVGGIDISRCGPPGDLMYLAETHYADIVPDQRIVSMETVSEHGKRVSVSLVTMEVMATSDGAKVVLTDQVTALDDPAILAGHQQGYSGALDNLTAWLKRRDAA